MSLGRTSFIHFTAQLIATLIGFFATVYFARVLGADILGTYFLVISVYLWLELMSSSGIRFAVNKRLSEGKNRGQQLTAAIIIQAVLLFFILALSLLFSDQLSSYLGVNVLEVLIPIIVVGSVYTIVTSALHGEKKVHIAALLTPIDRGIRTVTQLTLVLAGWTLLGMLIGYLIALIIVTIAGIYFLSTRLAFPHREDFESIISFAKYAWLDGVSTRAFNFMDTIVLGFFVSTTLIGIYEIAWNIASILAIFGLSISQVAFPNMSELSSEDEYDKVSSLINSTLAFTGLLTIPGLVGGAILGEWILAIYGNEFREGYIILIILISARLLSAYNLQFVNALSAINRPDLAFKNNLVFLIMNVSLNVSLIALYGWIGAAIATALSAAVTLILGHLALRSVIDVSVPYGEIGRQITAALLMGVVVYAGTLSVEMSIPIAITLVATGAIVYFLILLGISARFRTTVVTNLPDSRFTSF